MVRLILEKEKTAERRGVIKSERISSYFPDSYSREQIEDVIFQLLDDWKSAQ